MLKNIVTLIANIGGFLAIANFLIELWNSRINISARITDVWDIKVRDTKTKQLHYAHIVLVNKSAQMVNILSLELLATDKAFEVSTSGGYIIMKEYDDYSYPLFRSRFPVNIAPKTAVDLRLEVTGDVVWNDLTEVKVVTASRSKTVPLSKKDLRSVDQYQFR